MLHYERCLIIPDVHQDIAWVARILAQEKEVDRIVFLGDYFDTRRVGPGTAGKEATCEYLMELWLTLGARVQFLLGNHDVQYLEAKPWCDRYQQPRQLLYECGSAFTQKGAQKVAKGLPMEFWRCARLFLPVNGCLLSHAGLTADFWPQMNDIEQALSVLDAEATDALAMKSEARQRLLDVGRARGGPADVGGLTWLDWDDEFKDGLPLPQIVGHTVSHVGARQKGRSWCIDGFQTCYGLLTPSGFEVRRA